jgi:hypothetical protein
MEAAAVSQRTPPKSSIWRHPVLPGRARVHSQTRVVNSISPSFLTEKCLRQVAAEDKASTMHLCRYTHPECGTPPQVNGRPWRASPCIGLSLHRSSPARRTRAVSRRRTNGGQRGDLLAALSLQRSSTHNHLSQLFNSQSRPDSQCEHARCGKHYSGHTDPVGIGHARIQSKPTLEPSSVHPDQRRPAGHRSCEPQARAPRALHAVPRQQQWGSVGGKDHTGHELERARNRVQKKRRP